MDTRALSPLVLAYVGDAVFELHVREKLVRQGLGNVNALHHEAVRVVKATAQAQALSRVIDLLSDDEKDIVRRGRNAKSGSVPKGTEVQVYRYSTGLEALIGHLHLSGRHERLAELLDLLVPVETAD
jgi:ribonuclease-3 family protein